MKREQHEKLRLREELLEVVTALWFEIDHRKGSQASEFFVSDAELRFSQRTFRGTGEINSVYAGRAARGPRVSRHVVANLHVTAAGFDWASAVSTLILFADDGEAPRPHTTPALVADVTDSFERHDGCWLIRSRRIDHLFIESDTTLAVPTE
ncbi:nuclear transport factor 2 family protein [Streptomyces sp. NBC_00063]|uniref:nuclear transport factor 2 family protein n=1 Tax=Streptomyces sp. NBC_00063 TaxID=2975638 RepID=UPI003D75EEE2